MKRQRYAEDNFQAVLSREGRLKATAKPMRRKLEH